MSNKSLHASPLLTDLEQVPSKDAIGALLNVESSLDFPVCKFNINNSAEINLSEFSFLK